MIESTSKLDRIATRASAVSGLVGVAPLDTKTRAVDLESLERRLKALDLWVDISIERDLDWEEAEDIRPARETIGGKKRGGRPRTLVKSALEMMGISNDGGSKR
ncbi:hypothetical protein BHE74_00039639 [Ensete ventricosum]|nr:hypothetical protein BHE74_00039639 [Ensete ventricosum]